MCRASHTAGGGAVEAALSVYVEAFATTLGSREQLAGSRDFRANP